MWHDSQLENDENPWNIVDFGWFDKINDDNWLIRFDGLNAEHIIGSGNRIPTAPILITIWSRASVASIIAIIIYVAIEIVVEMMDRLPLPLSHSLSCSHLLRTFIRFPCLVNHMAESKWLPVTT